MRHCASAKILNVVMPFCSALSDSDISDDEEVALPERGGEELPKLRTRRMKTYSPEAYKFYMEQHVENVIKGYKARKSRRWQLEAEMTKVFMKVFFKSLYSVATLISILHMHLYP